MFTKQNSLSLLQLSLSLSLIHSLGDDVKQQSAQICCRFPSHYVEYSIVLKHQTNELQQIFSLQRQIISTSE